MSKIIKVEEKVYDELEKTKVGHQTFSDVIQELITTRLRVFELVSILEGTIKYQEWKNDKLRAAAGDHR